ncbi:hypothetical protein MMC22_008720 [Lobaria immixta]|nr:hypothetical protein [Lobaria immixta]
MIQVFFRPLLIASITAASVLTDYIALGFPRSLLEFEELGKVDTPGLIQMIGNLFSLSFVSMGSILSATDAPEKILLEMWHLVFTRGFYACPTIGFFSSGISALNAIITYGSEVYSTGSWSPSIRVYAILLSGLFMFGMVPYTLKWVVPLEEVLLKKERDLLHSEKGGKSRGDSHSSRHSLMETRKMLALWVALNYGRMVIPFVGVVIAWTIW